MSFSTFVLISPQIGKTGGRAQFPHSGLLLSGDGQSSAEASLRLLRIRLDPGQQQVPSETVEIRLNPIPQGLRWRERPPLPA
jgi:hypothetical protein